MTSGGAGIPPSAGVVPGLWTPPAGEIIPGSLFTPARRRQAVVVARDAATLTCSLQIQGDSTVHPGQVALSHYVPRVGDTVWCLQDGPDWLIIGGQGTELPKGKMRSTATQTTAAGTVPEKFDFNAAGGSTSYDLDNDGSNTMVDRANSRIYARWPGKYAYGYHWSIVPGGNTGAFADVKLNNTLFLPPRYRGNSTNEPRDGSLSDERAFAAGDFVELFITSGTAGVTFGSSSNELGMSLWMSYRP